jgi:hypothetical protein
MSAVRAIPTDGPPPAFMALVNAVCASARAVWAAAVPGSYVLPADIVPGPPVRLNPVIDFAGNIPTFPVTWVGPGGVVVMTLETTGVEARIPKPQDVAKPEGGGSRHGAEVVNVATELVAK